MVSVYLNCRDRVRALRRLVTWLEFAGCENITLVDNNSTFPALLDYYESTPHRVVRLGCNLGSRALWAADLRPVNTPFIWSDPDIVPIDECPLDAVDVLREALDHHPEHTKAALGLDLRPLVVNGSPLLSWERRLLNPQADDAWKGQVGYVGGAELFDTLSDTTFSLYRPNARFSLQALRTGFPYLADHDCPSWTGNELNDEDLYYLAHAEGANCRNGHLPSAETVVGSSWKDAHDGN